MARTAANAFSVVSRGCAKRSQVLFRDFRIARLSSSHSYWWGGFASRRPEGDTAGALASEDAPACAAAKTRTRVPARSFMDTISGVVPFLVAHVAQSLTADPEPLLRGTGVDASAPLRGDEHIAVDRYSKSGGARWRSLTTDSRCGWRPFSGTRTTLPGGMSQERLLEARSLRQLHLRPRDSPHEENKTRGPAAPNPAVFR